jgi:hypothetical protein
MFKLLLVIIGSVLLASGTFAGKTPLGAARNLVKKIEGDKSDAKKSSSKKSSPSAFQKIEAKEIEQKICPVMGGKINPNLYYSFTKKIYVCNRACIGIIEKNPEIYFAKVKKEIAESKKKTQKLCPVTGRKIKKYLYYTYRKKIYVCCAGCIWTIKKKPEIYLKKVQKEIAASKKK